MKIIFKKLLVALLITFAFFSISGCDGSKLPIGGNPIGVDDRPTGVIINNPNQQYKIFVGDTLQLTARVIPETVEQTVNWTSNYPNIATIDETGLVTGVGSGRVKITATSTKLSTVLAYLYLTVEDQIVDLTSIEILGPHEMFINETVKYNYRTVPENASPQVVWSTTNENIATIDQNGRITSHGVGFVDIQLIANNTITTSKTINIKARISDPSELIIIGRDEVEVEQSIRLMIQVLPIGSINSVTWASSDEDVAVVDGNGRVTGLKAGIVEITASSTVTNLEKSFIIEIIDNRINTTDFQSNVIDVIKQTKNSILGVSNYVFNSSLNKYERKGIGSGFVYKSWFILKDGSIVHNLEEIITFDEVEKYCYFLITNRHVVIGSDQVKIYLHQEEIEIPSTLIQYDDKVDLAVIYFEYSSYIKPLELADSSKLQSGQFAIAIGNPSGYQYSSSATFGIISFPKRYISDDTDGDGVNDWDAEYIQHDVAINPGNSGGPLLDLQGRVIGINTLKFASATIDNMGFSIPSNVVASLIDILEDGRKPVRALIGVTVVEVRSLLENPSPDYIVPEGVTYGLYVIAVGPNSVASRGGIQAGDIILSFDDVKLTRSLILRTELGKIVVGSNTEIVIEVYRDGEVIELTLIF